MSIYHGKLLELIAIEKINEKIYLQIKLSFEHEVELFWEIDGDTAKNLLTLPEFDGKHKYRLSLHGKFDLYKQQCVSSITRTYLDTSEQIHFACSVTYKSHLDSIKNAHSMDDLFELPFLSSNLSEFEEIQTEPIVELETEQKELILPKRYKLPLKWVSVALISIIFLILFGYTTNNVSLNKTTFNNESIAYAKVGAIKNKLEKEEKVTVPIRTSNKDVSTLPLIPYLDLDDSITYSLPKGYVALTFDDGPSKYTSEIIDILKKYQAGGTFFFIGLNVKEKPDVVRYVHSNKYSIGSHSMNHVNMGKLSFERQKEELFQSNKVIEDITNQEVVLLRPPFGSYNEFTKKVTEHHDKLIFWNRDPRDWKTKDADQIFNYVRDTKASGSIILLHENQAVVDALPRIIEHLQKENLKIVSLR